VQLVG